jgi:uncharacterized DUF497 family protein
MLEVEFDPAKAILNEAKHGVTFEYGVRAFADPRRVLLDTSRPADEERRLKLIGLIEGRLFTMVYTMRGNKVRIISVRRSNRSEERTYGNGSLHI